VHHSSAARRATKDLDSPHQKTRSFLDSHNGTLIFISREESAMQRLQFTTQMLAIATCSALIGACASSGDGDGFEVDLEAQASGGFPSVSSFSERGPFETLQTALGDCTVFRPTELGGNGLTHPVIIWGNGTFSFPAIYTGILSHLASHGFIVAAANTSNAGDGSQMIACLDALVAANATAGSPYYGRVDTAQIGAAGHSQGGAGTIMAGRDPRVKVTAPLQPFITWIPGGGTFERDAIGQQQGPMLLVSGSLDAVAIPLFHQRPVFDEINQPVFWATRSFVTHFEPIGSAGAYRAPLTAWFRAWLLGDAAAAKTFSNPCTLCGDTSWTVRFR
jgi:Chlorophyllase enzyme